MTLREEIRKQLEGLEGNWSTVREELADVVKEYVDENIVYNGYEVGFDGGELYLWMEDESGLEYDFFIEIENVNNTWYISKAR